MYEKINYVNNNVMCVCDICNLEIFIKSLVSSSISWLESWLTLKNVCTVCHIWYRMWWAADEHFGIRHFYLHCTCNLLWAFIELIPKIWRFVKNFRSCLHISSFHITTNVELYIYKYKLEFNFQCQLQITFIFCFSNLPPSTGHLVE